MRYVGFEIADRFAIGYGLDHAERYRNLPYVAALAELERRCTTRSSGFGDKGAVVRLRALDMMSPTLRSKR